MFCKWTSAEAGDNPIGSPLNTRGWQIRYKVSLYSLWAFIILKLVYNNTHGTVFLSCIKLMLLIWPETLSKVFLEVLIHTSYLNESFNLSFNVTGTFHIYRLKKHRWIQRKQKCTLCRRCGHLVYIADLCGFHRTLMRTSDYHLLCHHYKSFLELTSHHLNVDRKVGHEQKWFKTQLALISNNHSLLVIDLHWFRWLKHTFKVMI